MRAPQSTRVCVCAQGCAGVCVCVCMCVCAREGVHWGEERSSSPYLSKMSRTINMQKAKGKAR